MPFQTNQEIVLASGNPGKISEIQAILKNYSIIPQAQFNVPEAKETGTTFIENAIIKARNASYYSNRPTIADDSGLVVDALEGAPGVISARYAGDGASDQENLRHLLVQLKSVPEQLRSARFICVIVFMKHANDPCPIIAEGFWEGIILSRPVGDNGFGYDPVFQVPEQNCSSAQLSPEIKNALSHRGKALAKLTELLNLDP